MKVTQLSQGWLFLCFIVQPMCWLLQSSIGLEKKTEHCTVGLCCETVSLHVVFALFSHLGKSKQVLDLLNSFFRYIQEKQKKYRVGVLQDICASRKGTPGELHEFTHKNIFVGNC